MKRALSFPTIGLIVLGLIFCVFAIYEVVERVYLKENYPQALYTSHIVRGVGTSLLVAAFLIRLIGEMRRSEKLSRQIVHARDDECGRIARELHDQLGQSLSALHLKMNTLDDSKIDPAKLAELKQSVGEMIEQVKDLTYQLHPPALYTDGGLVSALEEYIGKIKNEAGLAINFVCTGLNRNIQFAPEVTGAVYRIAQEALLNAVRHAQPKEISVSLHRIGRAVRLFVEDDGCGFDPAAVTRPHKRDALGIHGMQERAQLLGGILHIDSSPGSGTRVQADIPFLSKGADGDGH